MSIRRPANLNPNPLFEIKTKQAYSIAHSARCKLSMSARDPDRNLRFMLGHAFLLDKALYRVAQIDEDEAELEEGKQEQLLAEALDENEGIEGDAEGQSGNLAGGRVKFDDTDSESVDGQTSRTKKLPDGDQTPSDDGSDDEGGALGLTRFGSATQQAPRTHVGKLPDGDRTPSDNGSDDEGGGLGLTRFGSATQQAPRTTSVEAHEVDEDDDGLGLTRFGSATENPPQMIADEGGEEEFDEAISPPALPADFDVSAVISGPESEEMVDLYERIRGCPCHGQHETAEKSTKFWEIRDSAGPVGKPGKRMAIMQVEA